MSPSVAASTTSPKVGAPRLVHLMVSTRKLGLEGASNLACGESLDCRHPARLFGVCADEEEEESEGPCAQTACTKSCANASDKVQATCIFTELMLCYV